MNIGHQIENLCRYGIINGESLYSISPKTDQVSRSNLLVKIQPGQVFGEV